MAAPGWRAEPVRVGLGQGREATGDGKTYTDGTAGEEGTTRRRHLG
ncbi:hypothetical protein [Streptosporangium sp. G12]